ncbi:MAG: AsmA family protein [Woeseiaceae bacterium]
MGRLLKILLFVIAGLVGIVVVAAVALLLFFDPNDYREEISAKVKEATGRDLVIEGDLGLKLFPWLAVEVGRSSLGNAEGFGDQPFATFEQARLSVRLLPLIFRQEIAIGTASLDSLVLNLAVAENGKTNWEDLAAEETAPAEPEAEAGGPTSLGIADLRVSNAEINYRDAAAGSTYSITGLSLESGGITAGVPFDLTAEFDFAADPGELGGHLRVDGTSTLGREFESLALENLQVAGQLEGIAAKPAEIAFNAPRMAVDMNAETVSVGEMTLNALNLQMSANVEPFSYAGTPQPKMSLQVAPFSLRELMQAMGSEPPVTADPAALSRVSFNANAAVTETAIALTSLALKLDDTALSGQLSLPTTEEGLIRFDLAADSIDLDRYMAPADESATETAEASTDDIEIPVDLIRSLQAEGKVTLDRATLSGMLFEKMELGLVSRGGKMRLHPIAATLFEGTYSGDVRIDASKETPSISADEKVEGVKLTPLARSMFDQENISGTIAGSFKLSGSGKNLAEIRSDLDGNMAFELADGAWEGTDIWYHLRAARALLKKEQPPERRNPPRTEFTSVVVAGTVTDGIFKNDDLLAELPFMQVTGEGTVDLVKAAIDYSLQARVLERPEFVDGANQGELDDFTEAVIPLSVTGPLASPSVRPDIQGMLKAEVKKAVEEKGDELKQRVLDQVLGGKDEPADEDENDKEEDIEDKLKDLFDH